MAAGSSRWRTARDMVSKRLAIIVALVRALPWVKVWRLQDRGAPLVVWIHHRFPTSFPEYLVREDTAVKDAALINALCERGVPFRLVFGTGIDQVRDRTVIYTIHPYNPDRVHDYSVGLVRALRRIEGNGNRLIPSSAEAEWWENKVFMHRRFDELGVHAPATTVLDLTAPVDVDAFDYPILAKEPHSSGSRGLHALASRADLRRVVDEQARAGETELLIQQQIDMHRDLRVTIVGDRVVHSYFRINTGEAWRPTSTKRGSITDFEHFPEQWRAYLLEVFSRFGMHSGAFDVCWEGDDLDTEPYILEVSPSYTPNPSPPPGWDQPYYVFKTKHWGRQSYPRASVAKVFEIARDLVVEYGVVDTTSLH